MDTESVGSAERPQASERVLIYDGQCRLCVTAKERLESLGRDQDVRFVPYQSEEAACRLGRVYRPGRPDVAFLVEQNGTITCGLDAFLPLLSGLRGGRLLQALVRLPLVRLLTYLAYRLVARYRYRLFGRARNMGSFRTEVDDEESCVQTDACARFRSRRRWVCRL